jgi:hypothetical protein
VAGLWRCAGLGLWVVCAAASAQARLRVELHAPVRAAGGAIPAGAAEVLVEMASRAGVIFTGQVVAVTRLDAAGYVDVRFHVEEGLRGAPHTGIYVLREWAGLWSGNPDRYRVGQRLLMLLTARGPSGMNAPVSGMDGAIPLLATAREPLANGTGVAPAEDENGAAVEAVDLRWIQARMVRSGVGATQWNAASFVEAPGPELLGPVEVVGRGVWSGPVGPLDPAPKGADPVRGASLGAVLSLLRGASGVADVVQR